ncbi:MAG: SMP-30/gluconolactonase/LRE family protein [Chromatiales bacterium]|nr:MAG: SMP-30/gluconolactonase/LRE family protein [Chromatiales bacterium]
MRKLIRLFLRLVGLVLVLSLVFVAIVAWRGHFFRGVESSFAGTCEPLPLDGSAEDIQLDRARGLAYLSVLDRQGLVDGGVNVQGTVLRVNLNLKPLRAEPALLSKPEHFRPHGLSLHVDERGRRYLFALNHPVNRGSEPEMLEIFEERSPGLFRHVQTISDPLLLSPNDVVAVGPREAYVANDKAASSLGNVLQQIGIGGSPVTYVSNGKASVVVDNIAAGGGIAASADGSTIYVAETAAQRVRVLERDPDDGSLTEVDRIAVDTSPDNIDVAEDGSLWIGAHSNTLKLIQHFAQGKPAPSQVRRVQVEGVRAQDDIYLNDGREISASSVGVRYDNLLLIGSITARKVLVCTLN